MTKTRYSVVVGNIGLVFEHASSTRAYACYQSYVESSKAPYGRASGEDVTLFQDDEPIRMYVPTVSIKVVDNA